MSALVSPELRTDAPDLEHATAEELDAYLRGLEAGDVTYVRDGQALRALNRRKLYQPLGYPTFTAWCKDCWAKGRSDAYARIDGANIVDAFRAGGATEFPRNVAQVRALAPKRLTDAQRLDVWTEALSRYGLESVTADKLKALVAELCPPTASTRAKAQAAAPEPPKDTITELAELLGAVGEKVRAFEARLYVRFLDDWGQLHQANGDALRGHDAFVQYHADWWAQLAPQLAARIAIAGSRAHPLAYDAAARRLTYIPSADLLARGLTHVYAALALSFVLGAEDAAPAAAEDAAPPALSATTDIPTHCLRVELKTMTVLGGTCVMCDGWQLGATERHPHTELPSVGHPWMWVAFGAYHDLGFLCIPCALRAADDPSTVLVALRALVAAKLRGESGAAEGGELGMLPPATVAALGASLQTLTAADVVPLPREAVLALQEPLARQHGRRRGRRG